MAALQPHSPLDHLARDLLHRRVIPIEVYIRTSRPFPRDFLLNLLFDSYTLRYIVLLNLNSVVGKCTCWNSSIR